MLTRRKCCCSTGLCAVYSVRICPNLPSSWPGYAPEGALVRILTASGGTLVTEGYTDSNGDVTLCVPTSATRYVEVSGVEHVPTFGSSVFTGTTNRTLSSSTVASGWCCNTQGRDASRCSDDWSLMPLLYITDANGTYAPIGGCNGGWQAGAPVPVIATLVGIVCTGGGPGTVAVDYTLEGLPGGWKITRTWAETGSPDSGGAYYYRPRVGGCGGPGGGSSSAIFGPVDCRNFFASVPALTQTNGNLSDPVSGGVVISG